MCHGALGHELFHMLVERISQLARNGHKLIELDFSAVTAGFPEGGVPLVALVSRERLRGLEFRLHLPRSKVTADLFVNTSWAHFLDPRQFKITSDRRNYQLPVFHFRDHGEQDEVVSRLLDVVFRSVVLSRDLQDALEWSVAEITENVLTHSESPVGGYLQAVAFENSVQFTVADAGIGVFRAIRDSLPHGIEPADALVLACEAGVTGRPKTNAGNGLAGSRLLAFDSGGLFGITSGAANYVVNPSTAEQILIEDLDEREAIEGTAVTVRIGNQREFSASASISQLGNPSFGFHSRLDALFDTGATGRFSIEVANACTNFLSRRSGRELRSLIHNALVRAGSDPLAIDLGGVDAPSSSFVDEAFGILAAEMGETNFVRRIRVRRANRFALSAIEAAVSRRLQSAKLSGQ